jgi:hypothetical protein
MKDKHRASKKISGRFSAPGPFPLSSGSLPVVKAQGFAAQPLLC